MWLAALGIYNAIPNWLKVGFALLVVAGVIFMSGDLRGRRMEHIKCVALAQKALTAANDQDLAAEKEGRAQDLEITNSLAQKAKEDHDTIEALEKRLATGPEGNKCVYDDRTADPDERPRRVPNRSRAAPRTGH